MLVIVGIRRLDNDRIEIGVARPQHDSNAIQNYPSEKEIRAVLSDFGISEETIASHPKLLAQMGACEQRGKARGHDVDDWLQAEAVLVYGTQRRIPICRDFRALP